VAVSIKTGRGNYWLKTAAPAERDPDGTLLTLVLERADGIERVAFRCRIASELVNDAGDEEAILARLSAWIEREFEMTRENALKTIRSERKMMDIVFDTSNRGPF
jgi:hypothetical protein